MANEVATPSTDAGGSSDNSDVMGMAQGLLKQMQSRKQESAPAGPTSVSASTPPITPVQMQAPSLPPLISTLSPQGYDYLHSFLDALGKNNAGV